MSLAEERTEADSVTREWGRIVRNKITESFRLLYGPYRAPRCLVADVLTCELRDRDVEVGGMSAGLIQWPTAKTKARRSLILCGDLVRAVRCESNIAVAHHWGVSTYVVTKWRRALDVASMNAGSLRLMRIVVAGAQDASRTPASCAKRSATKTGRPAHPRVRAALLRTAQAPRLEKWRKALSRRRKQQYADGTLKRVRTEREVGRVSAPQTGHPAIRQSRAARMTAGRSLAGN